MSVRGAEGEEPARDTEGKEGRRPGGPAGRKGGSSAGCPAHAVGVAPGCLRGSEEAVTSLRAYYVMTYGRTCGLPPPPLLGRSPWAEFERQKKKKIPGLFPTSSPVLEIYGGHAELPARACGSFFLSFFVAVRSYMRMIFPGVEPLGLPRLFVCEAMHARGPVSACWSCTSVLRGISLA